MRWLSYLKLQCLLKQKDIGPEPRFELRYTGCDRHIPALDLPLWQEQY